MPRYAVSLGYGLMEYYLLRADSSDVDTTGRCHIIPLHMSAGHENRGITPLLLLHHGAKMDG